MIPFSLPRAFGKMVGDNRQGYALVAVMASSGLAAVGGISFFECAALGHRARSWPAARWRARKSGSASPARSLFAASTTVTSTGAVELLPRLVHRASAAGSPLFDMMLGEIAPGGIGSGLYGMLILAIVTVFVAGLMVGRTPEYLGKKIRPAEMKYAALYILATPCGRADRQPAIAIGYACRGGAIFNAGPHGLTEVVYAFTSMANNNGSAFAGLGTGTTTCTRSPAASRCCSAGSRRDLRARAGRLAGQTAADAGDRGHARDAQRRCSSACSSAWSSSSSA